MAESSVLLSCCRVSWLNKVTKRRAAPHRATADLSVEECTSHVVSHGNRFRQQLQYVTNSRGGLRYQAVPRLTEAVRSWRTKEPLSENMSLVLLFCCTSDYLCVGSSLYGYVSRIRQLSLQIIVKEFTQLILFNYDPCAKKDLLYEKVRQFNTILMFSMLYSIGYC